MHQNQPRVWLAERAFKQVESFEVEFLTRFSMCQHSNFFQTFTLKHYYITLRKTTKSANMLPQDSFETTDFYQKGPTYKQSTIQLFETFNIYLFETINVTGRGISKLVFQPSFRMKSGVQVKQQLIEEHSIFMYFPCSLRVLPTRKSAQLSYYSACGITDIFAIY